MTRITIASTLLGLLLVSACEVEEDSFSRKNHGAGGGADDANDPNSDALCAKGVAHVGLGGTDFTADRTAGALGADRRRVKPFSALTTEFARALGQAPASMTASAAAFGEVPPRWYVEPTAGAVSLYTTYSLAFTGCYDTLTGPAYQQPPTPESAANECKTLQRKAWQRSPTPEETQACVDLATGGLATEPVARRRWAHACAAVMTAAPFTTF